MNSYSQLESEKQADSILRNDPYYKLVSLIKLIIGLSKTRIIKYFGLLPGRNTQKEELR